MTALRTPQAWVDESVIGRSATQPEGVYLLAATIGNAEECDEVRDALRALLLGRSQRLHWTHESAKRRLLVAREIAAQPVTHVVVVGLLLDNRRQERARRLCMDRLIFELSLKGVSSIWVESRHESLNRRDGKMFDALRDRGTLGADVVVEFARPREEPLLWAPDAVAGAVGGARKGNDRRPRDILGQRVAEFEIRLT